MGVKNLPLTLIYVLFAEKRLKGVFKHRIQWNLSAPPSNVISPPTEIELWDEDQTNPWDVLSPIVPELTSLSHILTPPGRVKEKGSDLRIYRFSQITLD